MMNELYWEIGFFLKKKNLPNWLNIKMNTCVGTLCVCVYNIYKIYDWLFNITEDFHHS